MVAFKKNFNLSIPLRKALKNWQYKHGKNFEEFVEFSGLSRATITNLMSPKNTRSPRIDTLIQLSIKLDYNLLAEYLEFDFTVNEVAEIEIDGNKYLIQGDGVSMVRERFTHYEKTNQLLNKLVEKE